MPGLNGDKGDIGLQGIQGEPGIDGAPREVGPQGPVGPEGSGQTINLTINPLQFPGIVAEDFTSLFSDAVNNTAGLSIGPCNTNEAVIINGPATEILKAPGCKVIKGVGVTYFKSLRHL